MLSYTTNKAESINVNKMLHQKCKYRLLAAACALGLSASSFAAGSSDNTATAYVDSVYEWGSWELGLQPAAGGQAPSPQRAVTARNSNVQFRPNDNSAFSPDARAVIQTTISPAPLPAPVPAIAPANGVGTAVPGQLPTTSGPDRWL